MRPLGPTLRHLAADIKIAHSVFALPFALLAAILARDPERGWPVFAGQLTLVVLCMVAARTWAMLVNRLADRAFDADNPRTAGRAIPSGRVTPRAAAIAAALAAAAFVALAAGFLAFGNTWPVMLALPVLAWIALYSFTKRWTVLCHLFLGASLAASPLAAALAVRPEALTQTSALWWLSGMVVLWVAGFDILYSVADAEFDRRRGLSSVPARLGAGVALWASRVAHVGAIALLAQAWRSEPRFGLATATGFGLASVIVLIAQVLAGSDGGGGRRRALAFALNGGVSVSAGLAASADVLW